MQAALLRTLDGLPAVVAYLDLELRYRFANEAHTRWRGVKPESLIGLTLVEAWGPELASVTDRPVAEAREGRVGTAEVQISDSWPFSFVRITITPDRSDDGELLGYILMATDLTGRRRLEDQLRHSQLVFDNAFERAVIGKALVDVDGRLLKANDALATMLGYAPQELCGVSFCAITHPDDLDADVVEFDAVLSGRKDGYQLSKRYLRRDGEAIHTFLSVSVVRDADGEAELFVAEILDITDRVRASQELAATAARLTLAAEAMEGGFWQYDIASETFEASPALARYVAGESVATLDLADYRAHIVAEDLAATDLAPLVAGREERSVIRYRIRDFAGRTRWIKCQRLLLRNASGVPERIVGVATDITDEQERQLALAEMASSDPLTGLLNRGGFQERVDAAEVGAEGCGLLLIDLDHFKPINDRHGHAAGDAVLKEVARRIRSRVRSCDPVCRLGGDEFALFIPGMRKQQLSGLASRLVLDMEKPFEIDGAIVRVGASIGAYVGRVVPLDEMLRAADEELYTVKHAGRGGWRMAA